MNQQKLGLIIAFANALLILFFYNAFFVVKEGEQVVIVRFGKPVRAIQEAGLNWRTPFIEEARFLEKRMLNWDGIPNQIPTRDKKYITVDTTARWRIKDPIRFIQSVQNENGAKSRLDAILDANTRDIISSHNLVEAVRNSNKIFDDIKRLRDETATATQDSLANVEEEIIGEIENIAIGREQLSQMILKKSKDELAALGIELIDVQIRRIMYEESVQQKVYARMISERERIAEKIRSIGKGEQNKIEGKIQRELNQIQSEAYKRAQQIRGEAEAKAIAIYASALNADPEFYAFARKLDLYKQNLKGAKIILSTEAEFADVIKNGSK